MNQGPGIAAFAVPGAVRRDCSRRAGQTPIQRCPDTSCRELVVPPAGEAGAPGSWGFTRVAPGKPDEASCAHGLLRDHRGPEPKPRALRACSRKARRRRRSLRPAPGPRAASSALPQRNAPSAAPEVPSIVRPPLGSAWLRVVLPTRALVTTGRLGGFPQVVPSLWRFRQRLFRPGLGAVLTGQRESQSSATHGKVCSKAHASGR